MSEGPGRTQRVILDVLEAEGELTLGELREYLPGVDRSNLGRAVRSLERMGRVSTEPDTTVSGQLCIRLEEVEEDAGSAYLSDEELHELLVSINSR